MQPVRPGKSGSPGYLIEIGDINELLALVGTTVEVDNMKAPKTLTGAVGVVYSYKSAGGKVSPEREPIREPVSRLAASIQNEVDHKSCPKGKCDSPVITGIREKRAAEIAAINADPTIEDDEERDTMTVRIHDRYQKAIRNEYRRHHK